MGSGELGSDTKVTLASGGTSLGLIGAGVETYGEVGTGINVGPSAQA
jgi:hypothetical protein